MKAIQIILSILCCAVSCIAKENRYIVSKIHFEGNKKTKEEILLRELNFKVNDSISIRNAKKILLKNRIRLLNTKLFSEVKEEYNIIDSNHIEVLFTVKELHYFLIQPNYSLADRNINVWVKEKKMDWSRINVGSAFQQLNIHGRNESFQVAIGVGYTKSISAKYSIPYINKSMKHGLGISLAASTSKEINYTTQNNHLLFYRNDSHYPYSKYNATLMYYFRPRYAYTHQIQLSYNHYTIDSALYYLNPNFLGGVTKLNFLQLYYKYQYALVDDIVYPTHGYEFSIAPTISIIGMKQMSLYSTASVYKKITPKLSLSVQLKNKINITDKVLYVTNRALGFGSDYVRGYEYYAIDGGHFVIAKNTLHYRVANTRIKQKIFKKYNNLPFYMYAKMYYDAGWVHANTTNKTALHNTLLQGGGVGLDFVFSYYIKVRLEYSLNNLNEKGVFLHGNNN